MKYFKTFTMNRRFFILFLTNFAFLGGLFGQSASVSPSRLYFNVALGEYRTQTVRVANNGTKEQSFQVSFGDFEAQGVKGKSELLKPGESPNGCSKWLSASPGFFTLKPGEGLDVQVIMQVPNAPDANRVKWASMMVKLANERKAPLDAGNQMGLGIMQTFQFAVDFSNAS